jgi:hypothetical protein
VILLLSSAHRMVLNREPLLFFLAEENDDENLPQQY